MSESAEFIAAIDKMYEAFAPEAEEGHSGPLNQTQLELAETYKPFIPQLEQHVGMKDRTEEISKFREFLKEHDHPHPLTEEDWAHCDDIVLYRYLGARGFDFEKAKKMLLHSLAWRTDHLPRLRNCGACLESKKNHPMRVVGLTKNGHVAVYTDFKHSAKRDGTTGLNHFVSVLEKTYEVYKALNLPSYKVVVMIHFEGFGWPDVNPRLGVDVGTTLSDQYPERMEKVLLIDAPRLFEPFMSVVKPILAPETVAKIQFVKAVDCAKIFHEIFPAHLADKLAARVVWEKQDKV